MGGAESKEWELKQEQIGKKKNEKNDTDKHHLSYPWLFYYWKSKEDFEWEAVSSMQENVLFCPVLQSHWIFYSITFSSEFITCFGTIFFFIILFVTSSDYMFSPSVLLLPCFEQAKCLYCEIFNPWQSVTLQLDEMSAV